MANQIILPPSSEPCEYSYNTHKSDKVNSMIQTSYLRCCFGVRYLE